MAQGDREKSCCMSDTKRHVPLFKHTVKHDDDQPIVLITAPTGSSAFQIGGSAIHSAFLLYNNFKSKPSWKKGTQMQLKLEQMMLSITDEISMVGFKQFQSMNQTMCTLKVQLMATGKIYVYMKPKCCSNTSNTGNISCS